jgi:hypothetical protein
VKVTTDSLLYQDATSTAQRWARYVAINRRLAGWAQLRDFGLDHLLSLAKMSIQRNIGALVVVSAF